MSRIGNQVEGKMKLIAWVLLFVGVLIPCAAAQRLPQIAFPDHYKLSFTPDFTKDNFSGEEKIQVSILKASREVVLNAAEITFQGMNITSGGKRSEERRVGKECR